MPDRSTPSPSEGESRGEDAHVEIASAPAAIAPGPDLWAAALEQAKRQPAQLSFLDDLKFGGMNGDTMKLVALSRARIGFIRGQVTRLSEWFSQLAQRTVRIQLEEPEDLAVNGSSAVPTRGVSQQDKAQAMNMPLTRHVVELFDATLIDLRDEATDESNNQS